MDDFEVRIYHDLSLQTAFVLTSDNREKEVGINPLHGHPRCLHLWKWCVFIQNHHWEISVSVASGF